MLFCFGLFALLLYNTVVANAECSYTYRNSSQQHIEAQSADYEKQGFRRCEFLIQLGDPQQQIELNFTRLSGFGAHSNSSEDGAQEMPSQEKEEEEEEEEKSPRSPGRSRGGQQPEEEEKNSQGGSERSPSSHSRVILPTTTATHTLVSGSKLSSIVSSPTPPKQRPKSPTHHTHAYANTNRSLDTVVEAPSPSSSSAVRTTTAAQGGWTGARGQGGRSCLPMVEIREVTREGQEKTRHRICREHHNTQTPIVFHYASSVRIVYEWKQKQSSGFTLYFDFSSSEYEKCVHRCDGSRCLTEAGLLCNGQADCRDRSDEGAPACSLSTSVATSDPLEAGHLVQIVVIPSSVVVVGVVVCVVCLLARHRWSGAPAPASPSDMQPHHLLPHHHHHHQQQHQHHHHQLHQHQHVVRGNGHAAVHLDCPQSHSSEGLTPSGCSTQECSNEQAVALLSSTQRSHKHPWHPPAPAQPGPPEPETVGLPPNIPVSPDGEEGYPASQQRLLDRRSHAAHSELFKPPPNKTVFDRESPPPYSLTPSPGTYGCGSPLAPPPSPPPSLGRGGGGGGGGYLLPAGPERVIRDSEGQPVVSRCYTMFSGPSRPRGHLPALPRLHAAGRRHRHPPLSSTTPTPTPTSRGPEGNIGAGAAPTDCDPALPSSPPRLFGAFTTTTTTAGGLLRPAPSPFPTSPLRGPHPPPPPPLQSSMPSETVSPSWSTRSLGVSGGGGGRDSDRRHSGLSDEADVPRGSPPSYQMVLSQDLREGRGGGAGSSPRVVATLSPISSSSPSSSSSSSTSSTTTNTTTTTSASASTSFNNNGDPAGV